MKKSFKFLFTFLLLSFLTLGAFADGFHVCVASYKQLKNAEEMVQKLEKQSISAYVSESTSKNQTYYRILLEKEFKKIEDARKYRDEVKSYSFVKELRLKDFWVTKGERMAEKAPVKKEVVPAPLPVIVPVKEEVKPVEKAPEPIPEPEVKNIIPLPVVIPEPEPEPEIPPVEEKEPEILEKNVENAVLSEETPYSVAVRSYKYQESAVNDCQRVKELGFDSYTINTFDDKSFFEFTIHAGAFKTEEEALALSEKLSELGIVDTEISNYNDLKAKIEKYDEIISSEKIVFDNGKSSLPDSIPPAIAKIIRHFPANKDFQIEEIAILDCVNYNLASDRPDDVSNILNRLDSSSSANAASLASFYDVLYRRNVSVFMVEGPSFNFNMSSEALESMDITSPKGTFNCRIYEEAGKIIACGENPAENLFVKIESMDLTKEDFILYLNEAYTENTLVIYPQLRKTLFVLPNVNPQVQRDFIFFNYNKVGDDYAAVRNYAEWALPIVGHSLSKAYLQEKSSLLSLGFYDLDYDFNAKKVHQTFTAAKNASEVSENNQPLSVKNVEGWYMVNSKQRELSFSTKSYVIAVDVQSTGNLQKEDLVNVSNELRIWD